MHVVIFIDLVGSTEAMYRTGTHTGAPGIAERLASLESCLKESDPTLRLVGRPPGDGILLLGAPDALPALVARALQCQAAYDGLPARLAIGLESVTWSDDPAVPEATIRGSGVNLTARLMALCPRDGVALTQSAFVALVDAPWLRRRFVRYGGMLKGLGWQPYWVARGGRRMADGENNSENGSAAAIRYMSRWIKAGAAIMGLTLMGLAIWAASQGFRPLPQPSSFSLQNQQKLDTILESQREQIRLLRFLICRDAPKGDPRVLSECYR